MSNRLKWIVGQWPRIARLCCTDASQETLFRQFVEPKLHVLRKHGFSVSDFRQIFKLWPPLMQLSVEDNILPVLKALRQMSGTTELSGPQFSESEVQNIVLSHPAVLGLSVEKNIWPMFDLWRRELRLSLVQIRHLTLNAPQILTCSLNQMKSHMFFFHNRFAETGEIIEIFSVFPGVVDVPVEELLRFHAYWKEEQLSDKDFVTMITKHPSLLRLSFDKVLRPTIQYMIFICRHRRGARLFVDRPTCFEIPLDELSKKVEFLMRLGLDSRRLVFVLRKHPAILHMDLEADLKPRVTEMVESGDLSIQDLARILPSHPEILTDRVPNESRSETHEVMTVHATSCPVL